MLVRRKKSRFRYLWDLAVIHYSKHGRGITGERAAAQLLEEGQTGKTCASQYRRMADYGYVVEDGEETVTGRELGNHKTGLKRWRPTDRAPGGKVLARCERCGQVVRDAGGVTIGSRTETVLRR